MMPKMIIANRLSDGLVIYMGVKGKWVDSIHQGAVFKNEKETERWLAVAQQAVEDSVVVDPYSINVEIKSGGRQPVGARETIRAFGPSVRTDLLDDMGSIGSQ
ncbi:MAG: DUF2849 domain-containing protein [Gammaproteobacteria bacterium]